MAAAAAVGAAPPRVLSAEPRRDPVAVRLSPWQPGSRVRASRPRQENVLHGQLISTKSNSRSLLCPPCHCAQMALANTRIAYQPDVDKHSGVLAYELVQGSLVQWNSFMDKSIPDPPTAVLLHGILGSRKNWGSFAKRLAQEFPMWQFLLVDLRCHGDSASIKKRGPHTVASTALDVLKLIVQLRLTPRVLVGHSFGGKGFPVSFCLPLPFLYSMIYIVNDPLVSQSSWMFFAVALSMVEQAAKPLARPVRVWVLDATPGKVRAGGDGEDHPAELIESLRRMPTQVSSKKEVVDALVKEKYSVDVAQWVATNLRRSSPLGSLSSSSFSWMFDLNGISDMYKSYEETNLWGIVENVPRGVHINFLKAERSLHRWALEDLQRIHTAEELAADEGGGVEMHVLKDAGHWVHADNPDGLFRILSSTFRIEATIRGMQN
uniref:AB hydrolase-1 domain-containing protein n=1 Tax=Leersia perrieri TaxID=77586 RepID=A0A0D9V8Q1_9ORYZ